jgi:hypothetical protein
MEKQPARDKEQTRRAKRPLRPQAPEQQPEPDKRIGDAPRTRTEMPPSLSELPG